MMLIFSKARRVVAWLGMPPTSTGMTTVPQVSQVDVEAKHQSQSAQNTAILALAQVSFFERTWFRQEIFAAHEVMFQSGAFEYPFHSFMNVAKKHDSPVVRTRIEAFQRTYSTFKISAMSASKEKMSSLEVWERRKLAQDTMNSILAVLLGNKVFDCSDERDRVYALIGMGQNTAGGHYDNLRIDYAQGVSEVYPVCSCYSDESTGHNITRYTSPSSSITKRFAGTSRNILSTYPRAWDALRCYVNGRPSAIFLHEP